MKMLSFALIALVGTMMLNIPMQSFADPQLDTLLRIATQARDNLSITISQINNVPDEIAKLYNQGSAETDNLAKAVDQHDDTSAKQHFLSAMQFFKTTNDKINSLNATVSTDQQRADLLRLQSEITRMDNIGKRLKTISINNHVDIDFTTLDQFLQTARQDLDAGNIEDASKAIQSANRFVVDAHHSLATVAKQRTSDRAKDFTEKQIERFNNQNITSITPLPPASIQNSTNATQENPQEMVSKLRKLVSEGKVDEAINVIKSLEAYQKEKTNGGLRQSSDKTSGNVSNNITEANNPPANPSTNETITNSSTINSPMVTNSTQISITVNSVNQSGNPITGMWTVLRYANGTTITSGFTPVTFTATSGIQYVVHVGNYQNAVFNHWNDGNTSSYKTITPAQNVTLTAYYSTGTTGAIVPSAKQNLQSTSSGSNASNATEIGNGTVTNKTKSSQGTSAVTVGSGQEDNVKKNFDKNQRGDFKKGKGRQNSDN
ncbi:MAG: hypothetical protein AUG16_03930 [Thaumarchaeota archaeon 13_1_20CM_2_39_20]|nr:MAG: hypothetical protein AUI59_02165 [Thaumarchaeota archaeon 13_1_40CM_2_39_13_1]OLE40534.1 MAG: hypothetical protein AUG16_03930 [Thaumarchaeota archaeon 13_1_20CM_2_39_20]